MFNSSVTPCIADLIRQHAQTQPDATALVFEGRETTYKAFDANTNKIANGLIAAGLNAGDRIAFIGKNSDLYFEYWLGAAKAGLTLVPINWRLAPPEVDYIVKDCSPKFLLCDPQFYAAIRDSIQCPVLLTMAPDHPIENGQDFIEWRDQQNANDPKRDADYEDAVLQLYTSGTTGHPKGVILTNKSLLGVRSNTPDDLVPDWNVWNAQDVSLIAMPTFHISGTGWGLWTLQYGAKGVIVRELDPAQVFDLMSKYKITKIMLVPTAVRIVSEHPDADKTDFSFLKYMCYGGSGMPPNLLRRAIDVFGCGFVQMYGMTETAGTIVCLPPEDHDVNGNERMKSIGKAMHGVEVKIIDGQGNTLPTGEIGEITTRSASNLKEYHNLPTATRETLDQDGWLRTGDAGHMDTDGYIFLADRIKDMIITGGENVYPAEVENALYTHPSIKDVAVIGVADEKWGEAVKAIIVPEAGCEIDAKEIIAYARERIAAYKSPKTIALRDELPRNPSGKVLRRLLRDEYNQ